MKMTVRMGKSCVSILTVSLLAWLVPGVYAQNETIRIDSNLVVVPATVFERNGRHVPNLKRQHFRLFEEGVEQDIVLFERADQPFTVLLLLDTSGSMTSHLGELGRAGSAFVRNLRPDNHVLAVAFSDRLRTLIRPTKVRDLKQEIKLEPGWREGDTVIYDAVDHALKTMKKVSGRKVIVLFSDGIGTGLATAKGTLRMAEEQDAVVYTIQFGKFRMMPPRGVSKKNYSERVEEINGYMRDLAVKTGGRPYHIEEISNLDSTFSKIVDELGMQYTLGYYPTRDGKDGERRSISVKVSVPNVAVRSRNEVVYKKRK